MFHSAVTCGNRGQARPGGGVTPMTRNARYGIIRTVWLGARGSKGGLGSIEPSRSVAARAVGCCRHRGSPPRGRRGCDQLFGSVRTWIIRIRVRSRLLGPASRRLLSFERSFHRSSPRRTPCARAARESSPGRAPNDPAPGRHARIDERRRGTGVSDLIHPVHGAVRHIASVA